MEHSWMIEYKYCPACGSVWYTDTDGLPKFAGFIGDVPDEVVEKSVTEYCGCNEH